MGGGESNEKSSQEHTMQDAPSLQKGCHLRKSEEIAEVQRKLSSCCVTDQL
jgi:hypothetical protein